MKEKRYFIEIVIKDSETLEPVRSISTSSDYPESILSYSHHTLMKEINGCVSILCTYAFDKKLPCNPDHNGECLVCDCWLSDCPFNKENPQDDLQKLVKQDPMWQKPLSIADSKL